MSKKFKGKPCVYCQIRQSISQGDHVFAREFFLESERANPIKVPACEQCNNQKALYEHYLTTILPFGGHHVDASEHLQSLVPGRIAKNNKLKMKLRLEQKFIQTTDEHGKERNAYALPIDGKLYHGLFEFIVKALTWYEYKRYFSLENHIKIVSLNNTQVDVLDEHIFRFDNHKIDRIIGKGTFRYCAIHTSYDDRISFWKFKIFNGLAVTNGDETGAGSIQSSWVFAVTGQQEFIDEFLELLNF